MLWRVMAKMTVLIVVEVQRILELRALLCCWLGWRGDESSSVGARGSAKCEVVVENHHCEIAEIHVPSDEKKRICKVP